MDKMKMESVDITAQNIEKIGALFPNCITETADKNGKLKKAINFDMLKQMLSDEVAEGDESYEFTWVGKKKAIVDANKPIRKTLRPCPEESVNWDTTENLYIEGDNIDVLKLLQESYLGKVKMIYIDPPYNTGSDKFVYTDDFHISKEEYEEMAGHKDENGEYLFRENSNSNPHFHSDWCSMIYSRLMLARNLLSDDGVIFISIGQDEIHNMTNLCNEIFGEDNHIGNISRIMKSGGNKGEYFSPNMEYICVFSKNKLDVKPFREALTEDIIKLYNHVENQGERSGERFSISGLCRPGLGIRPNQRYWVECPDGTFVIPRGVTFPKEIKDGSKILPTDEDACWRWSDVRYLQEKKNGNVFFAPSKSAEALIDKDGNTSKWNVFIKTWLNDRLEEGKVPSDLISKWENRVSSAELKKLKIPFDFAKPADLIKYLISIVDNTNDSIILDFFSGSATTAHAVMQLNAEDGGKRKFIMVQIPEKTDEKSEAYKAGYKNICEIGKERIRRAGKKILTEIQEEIADTAMHGENYEVDSVVCKHKDLDIGFRVLKLDSTNMTDVYYSPAEYSQDLLSMLESNIKADRSDLDLLFGCLLEWGLPLSLPYSSEQVDGYTVHNYNDGDLIACFDENIPESVIKEIARKQPLRAVFRDSSFADSPSKINVGEIFKLIAPDTRVKVI